MNNDDNDVCKKAYDKVMKIYKRAIESPEGYVEALDSIGGITVKIKREIHKLAIPRPIQNNELLEGIANKILADKFNWTIINKFEGFSDLIIFGVLK